MPVSTATPERSFTVVCERSRCTYDYTRAERSSGLALLYLCTGTRASTQIGQGGLGVVCQASALHLCHANTALSLCSS